jgi:Novel STAND NTPase 1
VQLKKLIEQWDPASRFGEVIEGPAERFGLRLEPGLTERLVEDTRHDDALPLLAFTLAELHAKGAADGILTLQEYDGLFPAVSVSEPGGATTTASPCSATGVPAWACGWTTCRTSRGTGSTAVR